MEFPHGFKICDGLYPMFTSHDEEVLMGGSNILSCSVNGPSTFNYEYTYHPEDVTTTVDLDGDTNNKAMWAATDAPPPEWQELIIFATPMFAIVNGEPVAKNEYKDAAIKMEVEIDYIIQFRDQKYTTDMYNVDYIV